MRYIFSIFILAFCCEAKYIPEDGVYSVCDNMPEYKGGMTEFQKHIDQYISESGADKNGSVFVSFIISKNGELDKLKVVRSATESHDKIALAAVKSAPLKWTPGIDDGQPVSVQMTYSVSFR